MENSREHLGSRLGFILLSAACAIGVGNVWKFPWMVGQNGGGAFVLIYLIFLVILGIPVMTMEFAAGRASQKSPAALFGALQPKGTKWNIYGYFAFAGNYILMMFYTTVTGWMLNYFIKFVSGYFDGMSGDQVNAAFGTMNSSPLQLVGFMSITVALGFLICSFGLKGGVERITKYMMIALFGIMLVLAVNSVTLDGAAAGLKFYLMPDFTKVNPSVIVGAMNQAFFTLSLGIGSMAIFGSYIGKEHSLPGESVRVVALDTLVALVAGFIIFPACFTFDVEPGAGPSLIFITLPNIFTNMAGGRVWGSLFFLFMAFAAFSTVLSVFENIISCFCDMTGFSRKKTCLINAFAMFFLSLPCALGFNLLSGFTPFGEGTNFLDLEDFIVSNCLLPLGSLVFVLFCTLKKGFGWDNFLNEANTGNGLKFTKKKWLKIYCQFVIPILILAIFIIGLVNFNFG